VFVGVDVGEFRAQKLRRPTPWLANSQAVALKSERERYADAVNIDIYLRKNFKKDWKWSFEDLTTR
jgi:hypothetical protein